MTLKHVSLCTGYGGLDIAAETLLGGELVWCAEWEDAPSAVIEARYPGVPNVRDVRAIPWWIMAAVDVLTAGYPCQPFSLAGERLGEDDPRHLWPSIAEGISIMRPRHVLLENVRGHLSLGFDTVLHDLNRLGYAVAWRILSAAAVGACHRRERLFIYAQPFEHVEQPTGTVLAFAGPDGWEEATEGLFGSQSPYSEPLPVSGVMRDGRIYSVPMEQPQITDPLFPTPNAMISNDGEAPETWLARRVKSKRADHGGNGLPLTIAVQMLPTPTTQDAAASGGSNESNVTLTDAVVRTELGMRPNPRHLLPTPDAYQGSRGGSQDPERRKAGGHTVSLAGVVEKGELLPTPKAGDGAMGLPRTSGRPVERSTHLATRVVYDLPNDGEGLLPTPRASRGASATEIAYALGGERSDDDRTQGQVVFARPADWGKYAAAVERHARMLGMAPPSPTQPNTKGNPELAPAFVEWMMCLEPGRVTDPALWTHLSPRKAREVQLRMLGNGVVPPQALAAYRQLGAVAAGRRGALA